MLLIDADVICYKAAFAAEKTRYLNTDSEGKFVGIFDSAKEAKDSGDWVTWSRKELKPVEEAKTILDSMMRDIRDRYPSMPAKVYLTGVGNFRHAIATRTNYKAGRGVSPTHLKPLRQSLIASGAEVVNGEESDDAIVREALSRPSTIIVSVDKDFLQTPTTHYNPTTKEEVTVTKKQATLNFFAQVISGDATDAIPGATGYGEVKAAKAISGCKNSKECWDVALGIYTKEFGDKGLAYALETARLVKLGMPLGELWMPPV